MGMIIDLKAVERRARSGVAWSDPGAQILVFTGVRYERWTDEGARERVVLPETPARKGPAGRPRRRRA